MATVKYFSGTHQVSGIQPMSNKLFNSQFPDVKGLRYDSFNKLVAKVVGEFVPVTRAITFKSNPSLHKCDSRCRTAKGGSCECSCGGQYHGADR